MGAVFLLAEEDFGQFTQTGHWGAIPAWRLWGQWFGGHQPDFFRSLPQGDSKKSGEGVGLMMEDPPAIRVDPNQQQTTQGADLMDFLGLAELGPLGELSGGTEHGFIEHALLGREGLSVGVGGANDAFDEAELGVRKGYGDDARKLGEIAEQLLNRW